jgi:Holliday junction DNA helicase RuvA
MIARLEGTLAAQGLDRIELRTVSGVTYEVMVPLTVLSALPRIGGEISLFTAMVVREDAWTLYGFPNADERKLFQRLLGTTGVGPSLAMALLSTLTGERLVRAVREGDLPSTIPCSSDRQGSARRPSPS